MLDQELGRQILNERSEGQFAASVTVKANCMAVTVCTPQK